VFFLSDMLNKKLHLPKPGEALPGRARPVRTATRHRVFRRPLKGPYPDGMETALFAMGSFWSAEPIFWDMPGVWVTAAGYAGGSTPNPTYQEVCTGLTGHAETVRVVFDPGTVSYAALLKALPHLSRNEIFWRMKFTFGSLHHWMLTKDKFLPEWASQSSVEEQMAKLIAFAAAGFKAK